MNPLDIALIVLLVVPALLGLWKGLTNLVTALVGIWAAFLLAPLVKQLLAPRLGGLFASAELSAVVAYGAGFVAVLLVVGLIGWLISRSLKKLDLQWANRLAGAGLGLLCGILIGGVVVASLAAVEPAAALVEDSALAGPLGAATRFLVQLGPVEPEAPPASASGPAGSPGANEAAGPAPPGPTAPPS